MFIQAQISSVRARALTPTMKSTHLKVAPTPLAGLKEDPWSFVLCRLAHACLYVLCDLGEDAPVADCYMVGAQQLLFWVGAG